MPALLGEFRRVHPQIVVMPRQEHAESMFTSLREDTLDAAAVVVPEEATIAGVSLRYLPRSWCWLWPGHTAGANGVDSHWPNWRELPRWPLPAGPGSVPPSGARAVKPGSSRYSPARPMISIYSLAWWPRN